MATLGIVSDPSQLPQILAKNPIASSGEQVALVWLEREMLVASLGATLDLATGSVARLWESWQAVFGLGMVLTVWIVMNELNA